LYVRVRRRVGSLKAAVIREHQEAVGAESALVEPEQTIAYECDSFACHRHTPDLVLLISNRDQVSRAIQIARKYGIPFVPRGSGTGLSGGALPRCGGLVLVVTRMKGIREIDLENRQAVGEAGLINLDPSNLHAPALYFFAQ